MRRRERTGSTWRAILGVVWLAVALGACGDESEEESSCRDADCTAPPATVCEGSTLVTWSPTGSCFGDSCFYPSERTVCPHGCSNGACNGPPDPCDGVSCTTPPTPTCRGNTVVGSVETGVCDAGACLYRTLEVDCEQTLRVCSNGRCVAVTDSCAGVTCRFPPAATCEGATAVVHEATGTCDGGVCSYAATRRDCAAEGQRCDRGRCIPLPDLCTGITCGAAPAPRCEGQTAVVAEGAGTCREGACTWASTRTDCAAIGLVCATGACIDPFDPCTDVTCETPPAPRCEGDVLQVFEDDGVCATGVCGYTPSRTVDCASTGQECRDGACVDAVPACDDSTCRFPPLATCEGDVARTFFGPGACTEAGFCGYPSSARDCAAEGLVCDRGACVPADTACVGVRCETPPAATCDGDTVRTWTVPGSCAAGTCSYESTTFNCASRGERCSGGVCQTSQQLCSGVVCDTPPAASCDGSDAVVWTPTGTCNAGVCRYTVATRTDCAASGGTCAAGACIPPPDPCDGVVCDTPPPPTCDGSVVVSAVVPGTCGGGVCAWGEQRTDCADAGQRCLRGACAAPPPPMVEPGELVFTEIFHNATDVAAPGYEWVELQNVASGPRSLDGLVFAEGLGGGRMTIPPETVLPAGGVVVLVDSLGGLPAGFTGLAFAWDGTGPATVTGPRILLSNQGEQLTILRGTTRIDSIENYGAPSFPASTRFVSLSLDPRRTSASGNDVGANWCLATTEYRAAFAPTRARFGTPGAANPICVDPCDVIECTTEEACVAGACVALAAEGDLVITELLPKVGAEAPSTRFVEIWNVSTRRVLLRGVTLHAGDGSLSLPDDRLLDHGTGLVVADAPGGLGGATPAVVWDGSFDLGVDEGSLTLERGALILDEVSWNAAEGWVVVDGLSLSLDPEAWTVSPRLASYWCAGADEIPGSDALGTPGRENPSCGLCDEVTCLPPEPICDGDTAVSWTGEPYCFLGGCVEDELSAVEVDCAEGSGVCDEGACQYP